MTREEQRYLRELKKPFALAWYQDGKARGWRSIAGTRNWCAVRLAEQAA